MSKLAAKTISDGDLEALRQRNELRARAAVQALGEKHVLHPSHSPAKGRYVPALKRTDFVRLV